MSVWVVVEITKYHDPDADLDLRPVPDLVRLYDDVYGTQAEMEDMAHMLNGMNPEPGGWQSEDGTRGYRPTSTTYCEARELVPLPEDYTL